MFAPIYRAPPVQRADNNNTNNSLFPANFTIDSPNNSNYNQDYLNNIYANLQYAQSLKQYGFRNSLPNLYNSFELEDVSRSLRMSRYRSKYP